MIGSSSFLPRASPSGIFMFLPATCFSTKYTEAFLPTRMAKPTGASRWLS